MEPLKIATVQFETRDNDKIANLDTIRDISDIISQPHKSEQKVAWLNAESKKQ